MPSQNKPPLVVIVGPTAVGKTEIAILLAERLGAEIVSTDSRLFYRSMDIGTAKPSPADRARVPHHLIDVADPDETWSLAVFQQTASEAISGIHARGKLPILVGGTGQYLRAILEGWSPPKLEPQPKLRAALEKWAEDVGKDGLHARLVSLDPEAAQNIDPRNLRRTIRALEVIFATGGKFSGARQRIDPPYRVLQIGLTLPRADLYQRIDERITAMLDEGWLDEVRALMARGYFADLPSMSAIGYGQLVAHLEGKISLDEAVAQIKHATRIFVRRQANWFKKDDPNIKWFDLSKGDPTIEIENLVRGFSKKTHLDRNQVPLEIGLILDRIVKGANRLQGGNFVGLYLHGSAAMGCFNSLGSDLDFLIVVRNKLSVDEKRELAQTIHEESEKLANGIEMSVVLLQYTQNPAYPTPFEMHFSKEYAEQYRNGEIDFSKVSTDPDLVAHFVVTRRRGIVWGGLPLDDVFSEVSRDAYVESLKNDLREYESKIIDNPVYVILNACRIIAYLKEGIVLSKTEGGDWALNNLDKRFHDTVARALKSYENGKRGIQDGEKANRVFLQYVNGVVALLGEQ